MNNPTPGFSFPQEVGDAVDASLKAIANSSQGQAPLKSVRPERQAAREAVMQPVVRPSEVVQKPMTPVASVPATPMVTADYVSLDLPSRFHYYPFKDLYIKPFRAPHLAKMAKVDATASFQLMAEVVGSVLATHEHGPDVVFDLTMNDFYAVLFWLRMNSYAKQSMRLTSECANPEHHAKVDAKELAPETLKIDTTFTETAIEVNYLDAVPDPEHYHIVVDGVRISMRPERVRDSIQFLDHPKWDDEEFQYLVRVGTVLALELAYPDKVWDLESRVAFAAELSAEDSLRALEFADLISESYGLVQTVGTKCKECGASGAVRLHLDAQSFLSPSF